MPLCFGTVEYHSWSVEFDPPSFYYLFVCLLARVSPLLLLQVEVDKAVLDVGAKNPLLEIVAGTQQQDLQG